MLGLHFGVFRLDSNSATEQVAYRKQSSSSSGGGVDSDGSITFRLIGESYISYYEFDDGLTGQWSFFNLSSPIPVLEGDLVGLFYDDFRTSRSKITIGSRQIGGRELASMPLQMVWSPTFVFLMGADELANTGNIINTKNATTLPYRKPALRAMITGDPLGIARKKRF